MSYRGFWSIFAVGVMSLFLLSGGCTSTVYRSKPGAGDAEFLRDKKECQALQRAAGLNEERIGKCLEAKGWEEVEEVEREAETVEPIDW